jgi:Skp family chaperone for outer membrane proteins
MNNRNAVVVLATIVASPALAQSHDPSIGSGNIDRSAITAPVGHRQPRAADVPKISDNLSAQDRKLDRALRICRGC